MEHSNLRLHVSRLVSVAIGVSLLFLVACWFDDESPTQPGATPPPFAPRFGGTPSFESPVRMTVTVGGDLLVSDVRRGAIVVVDPETLKPSQSLQIDGEPMAIAVLQDRIFVGNVTGRAIEIFDAGGGRQGSIGAGTVDYPSDLAVDVGQGLLFVVDEGSRQVKVFDQQGTPRGTISGPGTGPSGLVTPIAIAVDEDRQEVFVSDYGRDGGPASVKVFDYAGLLLSEISGEGSCGSLGCSGGFSRPQGIALDDEGRLYLADALLAQILIYDRATGELIGTLGGRTEGPPYLRLPTDVVIGAGGDLFVTNNRARTVDVYRRGAGGS